tara:strand:- start:355 stop:1227 length:873 start_codon:yes stop_codon:yes gene_type:complete
MNFYVGTANFLKNYGYKNKSVKKKEIFKIFNFLEKKSIFRIDTALKYDKFLKFSKKINFVNSKISTKIFFNETDFRKVNFEDYFIKKIDKKIDKFKIKKFETIFIHNFDDIKKKNFRKLFRLMKKLKKLRLTKMIGLSIYNTKSLTKINNDSKIDIIQAPVNIFNKQFLQNKISKILKQKKIKLQARSIFLQGVLTDDKKILSEFSKKNRALNEFFLWCKKNRISTYQTCVNFILSQKNIDSFVVGIENLKQLKMLYSLIFNQKKKKIAKKFFFTKNYFIDTRKLKFYEN